MEPFRHRRRVEWGECDPARIYFAPQAIDYALEAVEAPCGAVPGGSWPELVRQGREPAVLSVDCAYERSLTAGQEIDIAVTKVAGEGDTGVYETLAEVAPGEASFRARIELATGELQAGIAPRGS